MRKLTTRRPSPGTLIAVVALFVALGGTAFALQRNSVASKHIIDGQVKSADIADSAINNTKVRDNSISSDDIRDGDVSGDDIGLGAVETEQVANDSLTGADLDEDTLQQPIDDLAYARLDGAVPANSAASIVVTCPGGRVPISGGHDSSAANMRVVASRPADSSDPPDGTADSWKVTFDNPNAGEVQVVAYAICAPAKDVSGSVFP